MIREATESTREPPSDHSQRKCYPVENPWNLSIGLARCPLSSAIEDCLASDSGHCVYNLSIISLAFALTAVGVFAFLSSSKSFVISAPWSASSEVSLAMFCSIKISSLPKDPDSEVEARLCLMDSLAPESITSTRVPLESHPLSTNPKQSATTNGKNVMLIFNLILQFLDMKNTPDLKPGVCKRCYVKLLA